MSGSRLLKNHECQIHREIIASTTCFVCVCFSMYGKYSVETFLILFQFNSSSEENRRITFLNLIGTFNS
ncbi:CLUMA_CG012764, isoform A [Clunio marinus]|uniref:CLUMA_CG012764, isoform A n=1 Tax=Clunio marinus TaxID=568069 RepID=A0A1J1IGY3_9DIPT|nr:CLUMA_CG012764, isoform A [Clunio marinus]